MQPRYFKKLTLIVLAAGFLVSSNAWAFKKVYSPLVEQGELELEYQFAVDFDDREGFDDAQEQKFAIGYGVTDRWFTEVYGEIEKEAREDGEERDYEYTATEWENRFQLTEQGQFWFDLGFYIAYEWKEHSDADKLELKILLEKQFGDFVHRLNPILEKEIGTGDTDDWEPGFAWQTLYRLREEFQPGFEIHSEFGPMDDGRTYEEQEHFIGPVVQGKLFKKIKYNVGYLFGITDNTPEGQFKCILEFEHRF